MARKRQAATVPPAQTKKICGTIEKTNTAAAATLEEQLATITKQFEGIDVADPLTIKDGASMTPFSAKDLMARVADGRAYKCCCSIFICNLYHNPNPEVPIVTRQVNELIAFFFPSAPDLDRLPEITVNAPGTKYKSIKFGAHCLKCRHTN